MEDGQLASYIIGILILLVFSAYFSATETAFNSINRIRLKNLVNGGNKRAKKVLMLEERYDELLSTILVGNNLVNIAMTAVATVMFIDLYGPYGPTISTVVVTIVVLIFGEISPKNIAKEQPEKFAMWSQPFINILVILFTPINYLFSKWKKFITKIFKVSKDRGITEDELITIVEEAKTGGNIDKEQGELITNAIEFSDIDAWDVLTPRVEIEAIEIGTAVKEIGQMFLDTGFSRMPVYDDDLDNILGVLNQKDFHNYVIGENQDIQNYVKPVVFVARSMKAAVLLKKMQENKTHIAVVVDEYGGTAGLVTMEDLIEELVGKIYDEHDSIESKEITRLYNGSYKVSCSANVEKMFDFFGEEEDLDANTVNGWVVLQLDKLPSVGDEFVYESKHKIFKVIVTKSDGKKALEVNIKFENKPEEEEE
ncbi:MAG: HlyC/CorC family transporter [Clostridiales bacterium]|jgi:CBS domain containing-hemolysin-like protein|nr:HlyC/CorC family transporter [Clostridiales bacterium]